jgi:DNA-3-methyladenine glycosylase
MARPTVEGLPAEFYDRPVVEVAEDLIGCTVTYGGAGRPLSGVIVETEAYHESEPACHAFAGLTPRTETLFGAPGRAYVYRSYGVHAMLNAVCEPERVGAAVLIRALEPLEGVEEMRARRGGIAGAPGQANGRAARRAGSDSAPVRLRDADLCSGPGKLTQALGIWLSENGGDLRTGPITIGPRADGWSEPAVIVGTRVGITKAVELPWRFCVAGNRHVSSPRPRIDGGASPWRTVRA